MVIEPETDPFWVYVLVSESTGRRYVGQTQDLNRRLTEHNTPEHNPRKFTSRNVGPWRLVYSEVAVVEGQPAEVQHAHPSWLIRVTRISRAALAPILQVEPGLATRG